MRSYSSIGPEEARDTLRSFTAFLKDGVHFVFRSIRENIILFVAINACLIGVGVYYYKKQPAYYESQMVCAFNHLHKKTYGEMVQRLNQLAVTNSYQQLSAVLNISEGEARAIKGFDARNVAGSPLHEDITTEKLPLYFTLKADNPQIFPVVQQKLLGYLNQSPYREARRATEEKAINDKIAYLDGSMKKVDSVIMAYTTFLQRTRSLTDSAAGFSNIAALFSYQEQLEDKKLEEGKKLQQQQSVELVYGFAPTDAPVKQGYSYLIKVFIAAIGLSVAATVLKKMLSYGN